MRKALILVFMLFLLTGCVTSTETVVSDVYKRWLGMPVNNFFLNYGSPHSTFEVDEKTKMYKWTGGFTRSAGGQIQLSCEGEITAVDGRIVGIRLTDSIGRWRMSRCDEVFNP